MVSDMKIYDRCWKFGDNIPTDQILRAGGLIEMAPKRAGEA
jgi:hypothetical protein